MSASLVCEARGHQPRDTDPTGGDPFMGGPVLITVCRRCGVELPHSDAANAFNAAHTFEAEPAKPPAPPKRHRWWQRHRHTWARLGYGGAGWSVYKCTSCGRTEIGT